MPENLLHLKKTETHYVWTGGYRTKDVAKSAGMRWNRDAKQWQTTELTVAERLKHYADTDTATALARDLAVKAQALEQSRASVSTMAVPVPDGLAYLDYQTAGIAYANSREGTLIADEMGLGKTIQAIGLINADPSIARALIICPATLRLNWSRELDKWLTRPLSVGIATTKDWPESDIVIVNYDIAWRTGILAHLHETTWDLVILDESHYCKNPKAKRTSAIVGDDRGAPGVHGRRRLALTGTPITNKPVELYPTLRWLAPKVFPKFFGFALKYCAGRRTRFGWDFSGASHLNELQDTLREHVMVRRLKSQVLTELPAKVRQVIELAANGAARLIKTEQSVQRKHDEIVSALRIKVELAKADGLDAYALAVDTLRQATTLAFTEMSKVRHDTAVAKIPAVVDHVKMLLESVPKVVVMAHHKDVVTGILAGLSDYSPVSLVGDTPMASRQDAVDRFQSDDTARVFVGSIQAAGVGITLTAAETLVFAELDWVPANCSQAEDRIHRIGQTGNVLIQHLVLDGSIDVTMAHTLVRKQAVMDSALDTEHDAIPVDPIPFQEFATSTLRVADVDAQAQVLTPAQVTVIHDALKALSVSCDYASSDDGQGFNKCDAGIGNSLGGRARLTQRQAVVGLKVVRKYQRTQLSDGMAAKLNAIRADLTATKGGK